MEFKKGDWMLLAALVALNWGVRYYGVKRLNTGAVSPLANQLFV